MSATKLENAPESVESKYNRLLPAAKSLKSTLLITENKLRAASERIVELEEKLLSVSGDDSAIAARIDAAQRAIAELHQERAARVIKLMKQPPSDHHSMCVRVANILRPPV